jgi:filamentous hemagglutinin family protein
MNTFKFLAFGFAISTQFAFAEGIATDGTMGAAQTLSGANVTIPQTLGTTVGNNLFHSFADFNINSGQTTTFTGGDNLQNVISRVTGGNASNINGVLKSEIKNADFYFINPNGITFGTNSQVDVPAAFHVSTADKMDFDKNGGVFYADLNKDSKLSSDAPAAFGFLGTSKANNGLIDFDNSKIILKPEKTLDVVAGEIKVENKSAITEPAGEVRLVAMQGEGVVSLEKINDTLSLPNTTPTTSNAGKISVKDSVIDMTGDGGGRFALWGGETSLKDSNVFADNNGAKDATSAKGVDIYVDSLEIDNVNVNFLDADKGSISVDALNAGKAGNLVAKVTNFLNISNGGYITNRVWRQGNGGNLTVAVDTLKMDSKGNHSVGGTGIYSGVEEGSGQAGDVSVSTRVINLLHSGVISSSTWAEGNAGNVTVIASDTIVIDGQSENFWGTGIFTDALPGSSGNAGKVSVNTNKLTILNGGQISSSTRSQGSAAGKVSVTANNLQIDAKWNSSQLTGIFSKSRGTESSGVTGDLSVTANDQLHINDGGAISISNEANDVTNSISISPGKIIVTAPNIDMKNGKISGNSAGNVAAGNIAVNFSNHLNMNSSFITTTANTGNGGAIKINGGELIYLKDSGIKTTVSGENGNGGDISVNAEMLVMDTGLIQANAKSGNGGNIDLALQALIPSADKLIKGGKTVDWNSSPSTINVIQAASQTGVSGTVTNSAPQLNLSGVLANVGNANFDNSLISQDYCALGQGSSLAKKGKGGLPIRAKDLQVK